MLEDRVRRKIIEITEELFPSKVSQGALSGESEQSVYHDFQYTGAINPLPNYQPKEFFQWGEEYKLHNGNRFKSILISASAEKILDLFHDLVEIHLSKDSDSSLGLESVNLWLDSFHEPSNFHNRECEKFCREAIDWVVFKSILTEYEELVLRDGFAGLAVSDPDSKWEVKLDDHKLLIVYARDIDNQIFRLLKSLGIEEDPDGKFIINFPHEHVSSKEYQSQFEQLKLTLGAEKT